MLSNSEKKLLGYSPKPRPEVKRHIQAGFTIIELLVSVFIIALISAVFMVDYHGTSKRSGLSVAKQKLASDIRVAQNNSLGSKTYNGTDTPLGGWGAHFDIANQSQYIIFADKNSPNGNQTYDSGEAVETKTLPAGVTINSLVLQNAVNTLDIVFFPPDPVVYINTKDVFSRPANYATISLIENTNNSTADIIVNYFGLIDVQ